MYDKNILECHLLLDINDEWKKLEGEVKDNMLLNKEPTIRHLEELWKWELNHRHYAAWHKNYYLQPLEKLKIICFLT